MMGLYVRGVYNDVISMDHFRFHHKDYVDCDEIVKVDSFGFYTWRTDSSSSGTPGTKEKMAARYAKATPWDKVKHKFKVAFDV